MRHELLSQHRAIATQLDALMAAVTAGTDYLEILTRAENLIAEHFADEKPLLEKLKKNAPRVSAKVTKQHNEVMELALHLDNAIDRSQAEEALRLVKRFHALAQQNIREEERVMFQTAATIFEY